MTTKKKILAKKAVKKMIGVISFGEMLNSFRLSNEYGQVEMSNMLGISKQDLCNIEKGRKLVSVERAIKFAVLLKMPPKVFAKYALQDQLRNAGLSGIVEIKDVA